MSQPSAKALEGRASLARPSLRVLPLLAIVAAMLVAAPVAQALSVVPRLHGTTPASPSTSLAPLVFGSSEGAIKSSFPGVSSSALQTTSETNPANVIKLYTDPACEEGSLAAQGTAADLDGAGIQVTVKPDTTTSFFAKQTEGSETSDCSEALVYQHMTKLPDPPAEEPPGGSPPPTETSNPPAVDNSKARPAAPRLRTVPGGWANDNTPIVTGSAPGAATVKIFTNGDCSGSPVAKGTATQLAFGFELRVVDNDVIAFYGVSVAPGGGQSVCSEPVYYTEDSTAPHTRITMGPASKTRKRSTVFRFTDTTGDGLGTTFLCKVDRRKWRTCNSPLRLRRLNVKRHVVRVKAFDAAGNREARGAKRRFKVVAAP